MMKHEFENLTGLTVTMEEYIAIEKSYMNSKLDKFAWCKRYCSKNSEKPLTKELKEIKNIIKDFKDNRSYAKRLEEEIIRNYAERTAQYDTENWSDRRTINILTERRDRDIRKLYDDWGNDVTIQIIYTDGSQCIAFGEEIVSGEITPKLQHIAYAFYQDGWTAFDTLTGSLDDIWNLEEDEGLEAREEYFNNIERKYKTTWGLNHPA